MPLIPDVIESGNEACLIRTKRTGNGDSCKKLTYPFFEWQTILFSVRKSIATIFQAFQVKSV